MLQIALASFLVWGFFKLKEKDSVMDGFSSFSLVLAPALIVFIVSMAVKFVGLSQVFIYVAEAMYLIVPFFLIKAMTEYSYKKSAGYSLVVFMIVMISQLPFVFLAQSTV
jgi:hypothetical protein